MVKRKIGSGGNDMFNSPDEVKRYAEHMKADGISYKAFFEKVKSLKVSGRILDVGAGPGNVAIKMATIYPDSRITALEMSPVMADYGKKQIEMKGLTDRIEYTVGDASDASFVGGLGPFDFIYASYCLHEFEHPEPVIRSLLSILGDGGTMYFFDLRRVWWMAILPLKGGMYDSIRASFTAGEARDMVHRLGITDVESHSIFPFMLSLVIRK